MKLFTLQLKYLIIGLLFAITMMHDADFNNDGSDDILFKQEDNTARGSLF